MPFNVCTTMKSNESETATSQKSRAASQAWHGRECIFLALIECLYADIKHLLYIVHLPYSSYVGLLGRSGCCWAAARKLTVHCACMRRYVKSNTITAEDVVVVEIGALLMLSLLSANLPAEPFNQSAFLLLAIMS